MSRKRYGVPFWLARVPKKRRPVYPQYRRHAEVEVVIVGGGMTGCATAYAFAAAGIPVALVEAGALGQGATASSTGLLMQEPETDYRPLEDMYGRRAARRVWQMSRRAMLECAATLRRLKVRCSLEPQDAIYFTRDTDQVAVLQRDLAARRAAGIGATWLTGDRLRAVTGLDGLGGIRTRGNHQVDPYRACLGLAAAAARRGARIHESSPVTKIRANRKAIDVMTDGGTFRAERVIVATGAGSSLFKPLDRHVRATHTYTVMTPPLGAKIRAGLGRRDAMLWDTEEPYHYLRWTRDYRILFGGADQSSIPARRRENVLIQRTGQLMYELSTLYPVISGVQPDHAWDGVITSTTDGLPFIGPHRNYPRHLFALGFGGNGLAIGFLAARILLRHHQGQPAKGDELVGFGR